MEKRLGSNVISIFIVLLLLLGAFFVVATDNVVADFSDGDYYYTTSGSPVVATITGYTGAGGAITIPSTLGGYPVAAIGAGAFYYNPYLTFSVNITGSVTSIGTGAFANCIGLTSVIIPGSVTTIGQSAFSGCSALFSVTMSEGVETIGQGAFAGCAVLSNINIPNSVTDIGIQVFKNCGDLKSIIIPSGLNSLPDQMFESCQSLESVTFASPSSLHIIGQWAFYLCHSLTSFTIPDSVTYIGVHAFDYCEKLENITIPDKVTYVGDYAFNQCTSLTNVTLGVKVPLIGSYTFQLCYKLKNITIPAIVTHIGQGAFTLCRNLTSIRFLGLDAPYSINVGLNWLDRVPYDPGVRGHAYADSNFPLSGSIFPAGRTWGYDGLKMDSYIPTVPIVPGAPTIGTATPGSTTVTVTWTEPTNTGSPITIYKVYYGTTGNPSIDYVTAPYPDTSVTVTGLDPGTPYYINVVAINDAGPGPASADVSTTTTNVVPGAPILDSAVPGNAQVIITWHAGTNTGSPITGYKVYRNDTATPIYTGLLLTCPDMGLINGLDYSYAVVAVNLKGDSPLSNTIHATPNVVPNAPTGVSAGSPTLNSITVNWTAPAPNGGTPIIGYDVFFGTSANPTTQFGSRLGAGISSIAVNGLLPNTNYNFTVKAVNSFGSSAGSSTAAAVKTTNVVPGAPTVDSTVPGNTQVVITWHAGTNTGSPITSYKVYRNDTATPIYTGPALTYTDTALINGLDYSYAVVAVNLKGDSPLSNTIHATPNVVPNAPTGVSAGSPTLTSITVSWSAPTPNGGTAVTGYDVFFGTSANPTTQFGSRLGAGISSIAVNGLLPNTNYNFTVKAVNSFGSSAGSSTAAAVKTTNVVPGAPTIGTATPGPTSVTVTWTAPTNTGSPITGYKVFYGTTGVPTTAFVVAVSNATSITISGLDANTTYFINIVAMNVAGTSLASVDVSTTTTNVVPAAPTIGTATPHLNSMTITWAAPTANGGSSITGYEVFYSLTDASAIKFGPTLSAATLTVDVTGLSAATSYNFYVVAVNALGAGPASGNASATTTDVSPAAPSGVMVSSPSLSSITVNWTAPVANGGSPIIGYEVFYGTSTDPTTRFGSTLDATELRVEVTGLLPGTQYYFTVKAINAAGSSIASASLATVNTSNLAPGVPMLVIITPGLNNVTLAWTAPTPNGGTAITGYRIYRVIGGSAVLLDTIGNVTHYLDSGLVPGDVRTYEIGAANAQGESAHSAPVSSAALYPPAPPTGVSVVRNANGVVISWTQSSSNATSSPVLVYGIYRGTSSGGEVLIERVDASAESYLDTNTSSTQTYYYRVAALSGPTDPGNQSSMSLEVVQPGVVNNTDWSLIIGIPTILILLFFFIFIILKRRKKKDDDEEKKK